MQHAEVIVVGSANMDLVFQTPRFPAPGETVLGTGFDTFPGGKGANQAVACGKLGARVEFVACIGTDSFGDGLLGSLESASVGTQFVRRVEDAPTGVAAILVDPSGQNCIVPVPGANACLCFEDYAAAVKGGHPKVVLAQLEVPVETIAEIASSLEGGALFILNPAPARELPQALLEKVHLITPNETETQVLTGILPTDLATCDQAAAALHSKGVREVLITLGAKGAYYSNGSESWITPSVEVSPVDTTAAGDAFNGALATFLAEGHGISEAIGLANRVGALSTTKHGAQASMPSREDVFGVK